MKFSTSLSTLFVLVPLISQVSALAVRQQPGLAPVDLVSRQRGGNGGGNGGGNNGNNAGGNNNNAGGNNNNAGNAANNNAGNNNTGGNANNAGNAANNATGNAANNGAGNAANNATNNNNGNNSNDAQTSLTLDPKVIGPGFAQDGNETPVDGQSASLTTTNNFINFCLTVNAPITNGQQIQSGSCNPIPIGAIPSTDNMPSAKFQVPANGDTLQQNTAFTVTMAIQNMQTGTFVNADTNYFSAPQQLNGQGQIIGHTHVVIETLDSLTQTTPTNPKNFAFFKGINGAAQNGVVTADVTNGLPAGAYRICSINSSSNHQPVIVPIAQHGSLDDCSYFTVTANGQAAGNNGNNNTGAAASSSAAAAAAATSAATGANNQGTGKGGNGNGKKNNRRSEWIAREY
ncbi:uncharacterized protein EV420DRAFT_1570813 [Desarmillaria tabescens]|uniref:Ribosomal protein s17 n=1 Tax=Armillaria tabescens TaxID=1929756 RepID=A0AA39JPD8_ARMTA|nr:uncharacterized protein EV420DRAFT_1570813 [Desarmillaria tabescens]KAK0446482.1 hypothetical protein EV420DRAFT_1570813 [Desarmillaria tabescens]